MLVDVPEGGTSGDGVGVGVDGVNRAPQLVQKRVLGATGAPHCGQFIRNLLLDGLAHPCTILYVSRMGKVALGQLLLNVCKNSAFDFVFAIRVSISSVPSFSPSILTMRRNVHTWRNVSGLSKRSSRRVPER